MYCGKILLGETVLLSSQRGTNVKTISLENEYIDILFLYISYRILIARCKKMYKTSEQLYFSYFDISTPNDHQEMPTISGM